MIFEFFILGSGLGVLLLEKVENAEQSNVGLALNGCALGSFLFLTCLELIPPEFQTVNKHTKFKFLALSIGFTIMALMSLLPHGH